MKRNAWLAVLLALVMLVGMLSLTACGGGSEDAPAADPQQEGTLSYDRIMKTVRQIMKNYSGYTGVTNEKTTQREDGTTARSFKYFDDLFTVTVSLEGDTVTDIIVLSDPNQLAKIHNDPYSTFILVASFPALTFYDESKWDCDKKHTALANVLEDTAEVNLENNSIYSRYTEDGWQYVAQCTAFLCTFLVSAEKPATTTAAITTTTQSIAAIHTTAATGVVTSTVSPTTTAMCAAGHDWQAVTQTVHVDEAGHYETKTVEKRVTLYRCALCYEEHGALEDYYAHFDAEHDGDSLEIVFRDRYETFAEYHEVEEQQWVVDQEEETVEELIGYECRVCGKKKN